MSKFTNAEKLKVFISSAQNDENGFSWHETRVRIKEYLKKERILDPFIMEDECSTIPSTQFYQEQVLKSDIVVLFVKGDVRDGKRIEFTLCKKHQIPLLVYFIHDSLPSLNVIELKKTIEEQDICTYCLVSDFSNIENRIQKDILNDVVRYFKGYKLRDRLVAPAVGDSIVSIEDVYASSGIPGKTSLKLFKSCYNFFINY